MSESTACELPVHDLNVLPTIEEAREFLRVVNVARKHLGWAKLQHIDFDTAEPGRPCGCLSYHALIAPIDGKVLSDCFWLSDSDDATRIATALGVELRPGRHDVKIPMSIRNVTDRFDQLASDRCSFSAAELRQRLVDAGVVLRHARQPPAAPHVRPDQEPTNQ